MFRYLVYAVGSIIIGFAFFACMPADSEKIKNLPGSKLIVEDKDTLERKQALMDAMKRAAGLEEATTKPKSKRD